MDVIHKPEAAKFVIEAAGSEAYLSYRLQGKNVDFYSTYVPEALRKRGYAEALVRSGLAWAKEEGLVPEASCWYAAKFIR
ncbi:MAG: GNAT family N-acetyltransferase [Cellvibrio sp.]